MKRKTGRYEVSQAGGETVRAFIPAPLPVNPPIALDQKLVEALNRAQRHVDTLKVLSPLVVSLDWVLYAFVRKEAVLSSQIEGTQVTLEEFLAWEGEETGPDGGEIDEVCNVVKALDDARDQLGGSDGLPISVRLFNHMHKRLMEGGRGAHIQPGKIRTSQNWIGGSRPGQAVFVPPPPYLVGELLSNLESFIHAKNDLHPLIKAAVVHLQFETIHPYLDGNGRLGRLLIPLVLEHWGVLPQPLLYLSVYLKQHRDAYYGWLTAVRQQGNWEGWIDFFLEAVSATAQEASQLILTLSTMVGNDRKVVLEAGESSRMAIRLFEMLPHYPVMTGPQAASRLNTTKPTANKAIETLVELGLLKEATGKARGRVFHYATYLKVLQEESPSLKTSEKG